MGFDCPLESSSGSCGARPVLVHRLATPLWPCETRMSFCRTRGAPSVQREGPHSVRGGRGSPFGVGEGKTGGLPGMGDKHTTGARDRKTGASSPQGQPGYPLGPMSVTVYNTHPRYVASGRKPCPLDRHSAHTLRPTHAQGTGCAGAVHGDGVGGPVPTPLWLMPLNRTECRPLPENQAIPFTTHSQGVQRMEKRRGGGQASAQPSLGQRSAGRRRQEGGGVKPSSEEA